MVPYSQSQPNVDAAKRTLDFMFGWFMEPLGYGKYPASMRGLVRERLPKFTMKQTRMVTAERERIPIGPQAASTWLYVYPRRWRDLLNYVKKNYNNPTIQDINPSIFHFFFL